LNHSLNKKLFKSKELLILNYSLLILLSSCSVSSQVSKLANKTILRDSATSNAFIGISIYEPATNTYWYNYNATKYFTPASNTKLFTLYAGMKYLGDSLVGIYYQDFGKYDINVFGTGDPTFLHDDFKNQPVLDFLKSQAKTIHLSDNFRDNALGYGWAWDDYNDDYMAERNSFPIYGNTIKIEVKGYKPKDYKPAKPSWNGHIDEMAALEYKANRSSEPILNIRSGYFKNFIDTVFTAPVFAILHPGDTNELGRKSRAFLIKRDRSNNKLSLVYNPQIISFTKAEIPFVTNGINTTVDILKTQFSLDIKNDRFYQDTMDNIILGRPSLHKIKSQPTDSLFKPMMHRSDNFFAEQTLLMVSNERLGYMNDEDIIDTLLKTDLKDIPQRPKWVDGSGLSRYNLFTPQAFIYILNKLRNEFGWDRVRNILPTGGEGTLTSYFHKDSGFIYAKTGTLSNNCALSGFLLTNSGKLLIFSILANHYQSGATPIRKATERFLEEVRKRY
jgi:D-alanyl-D-alanine carboxypeptidase/D-alanyl-D-alanine-endopeptidase (penicillin-binding protein 4)